MALLVLFLVGGFTTYYFCFSGFNSYKNKLSRMEKEQFIAVDCRVYDIRGRLLRSLPFFQCIYLSDGRLLSYDYFFEMKPNNPIKLWSAEGNLLWSLPLVAHHTINLCRENQAFVVSTSKDKWFEGELFRGDNIAIIDFNGKTLHSWDMLDHFAELNPVMHFGKRADIDQFGLKIMRSKAKQEMTHVNSVYEIPENKYSGKVAAFQKGNFLVNSLGLHLFILSADLKKILWISKNRYGAHDVKILENGNILLFQNFFADVGGVDDKSKTAILEINPIDESVVWSYYGSPKMNAPIAGSISVKDGVYAFTGNPDLKQVTIIEKNGEILSTFRVQKPILNLHGHELDPTIFRVQFIDSAAVLKNQPPPFSER